MQRSTTLFPSFGPLCMVAIFLIGCGTENPFSRGPEVLTDEDTALPPVGTVSFTGDIAPLLTACISCHRNGTGGWTFTGDGQAYAQTANVIDTGNPEISLLLVKGSGGDNHGGGTLFSRSSVQYQTILRWIEQGGTDN